MSDFFRQFPKIDYRFGDNESTNRFDNLSVYIDIIDQVKDVPTFYQEYLVQENERPDQLSYKLYESPFYHWTFFLMNDSLRESGWPVSNMEIYDLAKKYYPNRTITTETNISSIMLPETNISGKSSTTQGTILRRNLDLGQIIVSSEGSFSNGEEIQNDDNITETAVVLSNVPQYLSVHHYEDADGNWVDIDPYNQSSVGLLTAVSYTDRLRKKNEELRSIKVLKPAALNSIASEYKRLLGV